MGKDGLADSESAGTDPGEDEADEFVHQVVADWRRTALPPGDRALCEWAAKLTARAREASPGELKRLREEGFDDRAIHDAAQVVGFFNYITRIADGLGVEPEAFIREWGRGRG